MNILLYWQTNQLSIQRDGYMIEKYFIKGEGDYVIPYLLVKPEYPNHKALIYLNPSGKSAGAGPGGEIERFVRNGFTVLAPDLIGTGELIPGKFHGDSYFKGVSYNIWFLSVLIGRSILGVQVSDLVMLTNLLKKNQGIIQVYGLARKEMSPVLLHAAAFDTAITGIALLQPYSSYRSIVMNRYYNPEFVYGLVPGALTAYDLPDLAATLAPRKLFIAGLTDGEGNNSDDKSIVEDMAVIKAGYNFKKANEQLNIISVKTVENLDDLFAQWIK